MRGSLLTIIVACATACLPAFGAPAHGGEPAQYDLKIDSQPLGKALQEFAKQSGVQVIFFSRVTEGHEAPALKGKFTAAAALQHLLNDSQLTFRELNPRTIEVHPKEAVNLLGTARAHSPELSTLNALGVSASLPSAESLTLRLAQAGSEGQSQSADTEDTRASSRVEREPVLTDLGEVVVTGTNIRGVYPASSPVEIYTAKDIQRSGATTTEQFASKLPQNLGTLTGSDAQATGGNRENVNILDLRGLGAGSTLTLLNGRRLALANNGQAADISMIPLSAIERVEVLSDGASAVYGSDAIGGVVNFVLRRDFDGAETSLNYGGVTSGELRQENFSQTFGGGWETGQGLLSYDYLSASPLGTEDRPYAAPSGPGTLTPDDVRHSALATLSQDWGDRFSFSGDLLFAQRETKGQRTQLVAASPLDYDSTRRSSKSQQYFGNIGIDYRISDALNASLIASYSSLEVDATQTTARFNRVPPIVTTTGRATDYSGLDVTAMLDGSLLEMRGADVRFSIGAGVQDEDYSGATAGSVVSTRDLGRRTSYAFGELLVPLVGEEHSVPLVHRLELSLAARYTSYEDSSEPSLGRDFGDSTSPKVGLLWAPIPAFHLRATYGESFRAPSLSQIDPTGAVNNLLGGTRIPSVTGPLSTVLFVQGASPRLDAEVAESFTVGLDYKATERPQRHFSATYFNIDYTDRIAQAVAAGNAFANPSANPEVLYQPQSTALIEELLRSTVNIQNFTTINLSDPHAAALVLGADPNFWIFDLRSRNLSLSTLDGLDISASDRFRTPLGEVSVGAQLTRIFDYRQQNTSASAVVTTVDIVRFPVNLRARAYAGIRRSGFDGTITINYVDDYANPSAPASVGGPRDVDSWTTVDVNLTYDFSALAAGGFFDGLQLSLSAQNVFDEDPPRVTSTSTTAERVLNNSAGFDPANANPLGRFVMFGVSKHW